MQLIDAASQTPSASEVTSKAEVGTKGVEKEVWPSLGALAREAAEPKAVAARREVCKWVLDAQFPDLVSCSLPKSRITMWQKQIASRVAGLDVCQTLFLEYNFDLIYPWMKEHIVTMWPETG